MGDSLMLMPRPQFNRHGREGGHPRHISMVVGEEEKSHEANDLQCLQCSTADRCRGWPPSVRSTASPWRGHDGVYLGRWPRLSRSELQHL